eukprot:267922_1
MGQTLKVCTNFPVGSGDTQKTNEFQQTSQTKGLVSKDAPKYIYCKHPSTMPKPSRSYWGKKELSVDKVDTTINKFDPTESIFSSDNEQLTIIKHFIELWLTSNKNNRFKHCTKETNISDANDKNWKDLSILKAHGYGINFDDIHKLISYWDNDFNLDNYIQKMQSFNHFTTEINGLKIHFIRQQITIDSDDSKQENEDDNKYEQKENDKCDALLLLHGWPGSFWEFNAVLDIFKTNPLFENIDVIIPSLPGYGFSEYPMHCTRFTCLDVAEIMITLMEERLEYKKYIVVAGDWGSFIAKLMGMRISVKYKNQKEHKLLGILTNNAFTSAFDQDMTKGKIEIDMSNTMVKNVLLNRLDMSGYQLIHCTRPNTIGISLETNPLSILIWIYEKYLSWSDGPKECDNIKYKENKCRIISGELTWDDVIITAYIYWLCGSVTSGINYYAENIGFAMREMGKFYVPADIQYGIIDWNDSIGPSYDAYNKYQFRNIVFHKKMKKGGHFASLEQPQEYVDNIATFIKMCNLKRIQEMDDGMNDVINLIDTHIHLWDVNTSTRKWLEGDDMKDINITYDVNKYCKMYDVAENINLKYGIFMETNVEAKDIHTEINEITSVCENKGNNVNYMIIKIDPNESTETFMENIDKYKENKYVVGFRMLLIKNDFFDTKYDENDQIPKQFIDNLIVVNERDDIQWT